MGVLCWRTSRIGHLCSQRSSVCGSSLHSEHVGSATRSSKLAYALRSGVYPGRGRARITASARLEVAKQSAFQSYLMAVLGLLGRASVMVRRMRTFAVASEMGRGGVSATLAAAFVSGVVAWGARKTWYPDEDGGAFPVV